jgi:transcription elongation factor Elf1
MKTRIPIHYFKQAQRLEFHCPFCNQAQGWKSDVRVEGTDEVHPDPKTAFSRHLLGDSGGKNRCFVEPTVDEVDEYDPIAMIEA